MGGFYGSAAWRVNQDWCNGQGVSCHQLFTQSPTSDKVRFDLFKRYPLFMASRL